VEGRSKFQAIALSNLWPLGVGAAVTLALAQYYSIRYGRNVVDDAMTSMQYAKQLARGHGLVFNVGERVEGYTNFAWVMLLSPVYWLSERLGFNFVSAAIQCNIALALCVLLLVYKLAERWYGDVRLAVWLAVGLCALDNSFTVWASLGLEVHLLGAFMLLALWGLGSTSRWRWLQVGLACLGAHLTRPDAGLFCAVMLGNEVLQAGLDWRLGQRVTAKKRAFEALLAGAVWLTLYGGYFAWRFRYYGQIFPNTYYLKLGGEIDAWARGVAYLRSFLMDRGCAPLIAVIGALWLRHPLVRGLSVYNALHGLYVVYVGGDFFAGHRFFVPQIPQLALLAGAALTVAIREGRETQAGPSFSAWAQRNAGAALVPLLLVHVLARGLANGPYVQEVLAWGDDLTRQTRLFKWLREQKPTDASIATSLIGHTGFYSEARIIDLCGVIDPQIAHQQVSDFGKGKAGHEKLASPSYVLAQHPTFIAMNMVPSDLWQHGYYLRADLPPDTFPGIWQLDPLQSSGRFLSETALTFDGDPLPGWSATGTAFEGWPTRGNWNGQGELLGASGGLINSFHPRVGTRATGTLSSAPFPLSGDLLLFRVAGGNDADRLRVELLVDGSRVRTTTGSQTDTLSRRSWDITSLRGKLAALRIVDQSTEAWGYIAIDEVIQWRK
jgi:hypothetical protein